MSKWNMLGCVATSLLLGSASLGDSVAVSVADLGRGPENAPADNNHDIVRHEQGSGRVTLHFLTDSGIDLIESEFTLDGLEIIEGQEGTDYSAGPIIFNSNNTGGSGASANYEVNGRITDLEIIAGGKNHNENTASATPLDFGLRKFNLGAVNSNVNGTNFNSTAYVAPYPDEGTDEQSFITAFRIVSPGSGASLEGANIPSFSMTLFPPPDNQDTFGEIFVYTNASGGIDTVKHENDSGTTDNREKILHNLDDVIDPTVHTPVDDDVYYFNQMNSNGLTHNHYAENLPTVLFRVEGQPVQFNLAPKVELYRGGEVIHLAVFDEGSGYLSDPTFQNGSEQGGTGLVLGSKRRGPLHSITDFDPGSGYQSVPTITISDPHGQGREGQVALHHTEAFQGGPRDMAHLETGEIALLPGAGWTSIPADFNADGSIDLFWWNELIGTSMIWILQNGHIVETGSLPLTGLELKPIVVDLDSDGRSEIFWWNELTGATWVWIIDPTGGEEWVSVSLPSSPIHDLTWKLVAAGDRYGRPSIVWQSTIDGVVAMWTMSAQTPSSVEIAKELTYPTGEVLVPGSNWHIVGTGDLNGDGLIGDLLWWAEEYNRVAIWIVGPDNFLAGDYLTYNGQEVIIDATLGGIGTYTSNGHVNLVWNDGTGVVNWQMDRAGGGVPLSSPIESGPLDSNSFGDEDDFAGDGGGAGFRADEDDDVADEDDEPVGDDQDEDILDDETLGDQAPAATTTTTTNFSNATMYRISSGWRMNEDGSLTPHTFQFFQGLPADLGSPSGEGDGLGDLGDLGGFDDFDFGDLPDFGGGGDGDGGGGDGGGFGSGGITIPAGMDPCAYICSLDVDDPSTWPPEFQGPPPSIIQGIWNILIDGLLESYGCDPCGGGGGDGPPPTGACCNANQNICLDGLTEEECDFPGQTWLGQDTTCEDDCN